MDEKEEKRRSKLLSYLLRHHPEHIGLQLDANGWALVEELLQKLNGQAEMDMVMLEQLVANNSKKRFAFNDDKTKIRASQGHSVEIDIQAAKSKPPAFLYHGTVNEFIDTIKREGLKKMQRQYVHLSPDEKIAREVAARRGNPIILKIKAAELAAAGTPFYLSDNGVWLVDEVPVAFIVY
jgi:putative RNA 2'-phosphotransferase